MVYGSRIGPSADISIVEPWTKVPAAMMMGSVYPGIGPGIGRTWASTGELCWMASAKRHIFFSLPSVIAVMRSVRR